MTWMLGRREFLQTTIAGSALCAGCAGPKGFQTADAGAAGGPRIVSPGCRTSKVRVCKVYMGAPKALWPTPLMDLNEEYRRYEREFERMKKDFADVEFVGNELVTTVEEAKKVKETMGNVDGILLIHLSMGVGPVLNEMVAAGRPTMIFAAPYSGHEWAGFGGLLKQPQGAMVDCILTSDLNQLPVAVRPFRAIHHLREAKILNVSARPWPAEMTGAIKDKFGTECVVITRERALAAYDAVPEAAAEAEARRWISQAVAVVEPPRDEIVRSCRLALAFQKLMDEENGTVITADCYGTMYHQLPAFPCVAFVRLNNMGLGGICESDLRAAMVHILMQGLVGRPGFVSDPTVDESRNAIILAHCLGTVKMDGPDGPSAPYKLRTVHERQEGCVPQVKMRVGEKVTQVWLVGADQLQYFTGEIIDAPECDRGCRTKIVVRPDGDLGRLWRNWSHGLHRQTCYGNIKDDLARFCRLKQVRMIDEAA